MIACPVTAFPFATFRSGQRESLDAIRSAFDGGHRFVVLDAPTGAGKSAVAVALAREASSAYVLTGQKLLQDQYLRDFPDLSLMKGRSNYDCLVIPTHAAAAPCLVGRRYEACDACPYFRAKDVAMAADGTVMNYAYFLHEVNFGGGFGERDLLVLDEAHGIEGALMQFAEVRLTDGDLARAGVRGQLPQGPDVEVHLDAAIELIPRLRERSSQLAMRQEGLPTGSGELAALLRARRWLDGTVHRLSLLQDDVEEGGRWVVDPGRDADGMTVAYRPVDVAALAEPLLFRYGARVLMMSATVLDAETYLRALGIDPAAAAVVQSDATFPPQNRPIRLRPAARLTRHYLSRDLPRLVDAVAELMRTHPDEKGVVHAHSYRIARAITEGLPPELATRVRTHASAADRDAALTAHLDAREPTVLVTPSMTEGIDLADDRARWQAICKIPYPYLGDPQVAARREVDPSWYAWRTCLRVVQAYGRSVRSQDDHAVTYLLDADFPAFLRRERGRLPGWFLEAIEER